MTTIESALAARGTHRGAVASALQALRLAEDSLGGLRTTATDLRQDDPDAAAARNSLIESINSALVTVREQTVAGAGLLDRFNRERLAVGALGRMGAGKSAFLQSLTGLTDGELPSAKGAACTGTTTVIHHGATARAIVHFHSAEAYLSIISRYHAELGLTEPASLEQFWATPPAVTGFRGQEGLVEHLRKHWQGREEIRTCVGVTPREIPFPQIRDYVTQERALFAAVDRVVITVPYATGRAEVDVVDLPGLGDTNLTDLPRVLHAIERDVDAVVIVKHPDRVRHQWQEVDLDLYRRAGEALPDLDMEVRSFLLLNPHDSGDELQSARRLMDTADQQGLRTADVAIVDATSGEAVAEYFARISSLMPEAVLLGDRVLAERHRAGLVIAAQALARVAEAAAELIGKSVHMPELEVETRIEAAINALSSALQQTINQTKQNVEFDTGGWQTALADSLKGAEALAAWVTAEEVKARAQRRGNLTAAYSDLLQECRARLVSHFAGLEAALNMCMEDARTSIAHAILDPGMLGGVDPLTGLRGTEALRAMRLVLPEERVGLPRDSAIVRALATLVNAQLTYRGFLLHLIRERLAPLDPDHPLYPTSFIAELPVEESVRYAQVASAIQVTLDETLYGEKGIAQLFRDAQTAPGWAVLALQEEFVDQGLRSTGAELEWRSVYRRYKASIWREEFDRAAESEVGTAQASAALTRLRAVITTLNHTDAAGVEEST